MSPSSFRLPLFCVLLLFFGAGGLADHTSSLLMQTRFRLKDANNDTLSIEYKTVKWDPPVTAVIVCDMWDRHWCSGANKRVAEMVPRMNGFIKEARRRGATIVHAPSACMEAYKDHPARMQAAKYAAAEVPDYLRHWARPLAAKAKVKWPVDQSDGGCGCSPRCKTYTAWKKQIDGIAIKPEDYISDSGVEIGGMMKDKGIEKVILLGVHTNMCVIGRPFGLRNMSRYVDDVVLVRDLTDTMYNPKMSPEVSHVRGTELVVNHIEEHVCPTITSSSLLGGPAFRFSEDDRPHVAMIVSDDHYQADKKLPVFAERLRKKKGFYCTVIHGEGAGDFPAMAELKSADTAILFIRRLAVPQSQMALLKDYLKRGKPLIGMRTASHAFALRGGQKSPTGWVQWPEFDADVLGGNYQGHGPDTEGSDIAIVAGQKNHPILKGVAPLAWHSTGSVYRTAPVAEGSTVLMTAGAPSTKVQPLTWLRKHDKSTVMYTGLGHPDDFKSPAFLQLLTNMVQYSLPEKR